MKKSFALLMVMIACVGSDYAGIGDAFDSSDRRPVVYIGAKAVENRTNDAKADLFDLPDELKCSLVEIGGYRVLMDKDFALGSDIPILKNTAPAGEGGGRGCRALFSTEDGGLGL